MPRYSYRCPKGHVSEVWSAMDARPAAVRCHKCGEQAERDFADEQGGRRPPKEIVSEAFGVMPGQVRDANLEAVKNRRPVHYDEQGRAHFPDRHAMIRTIKDFGLHNKDEISG